MPSARTTAQPSRVDLAMDTADFGDAHDRLPGAGAMGLQQPLRPAFQAAGGLGAVGAGSARLGDPDRPLSGRGAARHHLRCVLEILQRRAGLPSAGRPSRILLAPSPRSRSGQQLRTHALRSPARMPRVMSAVPPVPLMSRVRVAGSASAAVDRRLHERCRFDRLARCLRLWPSHSIIMRVEFDHGERIGDALAGDVGGRAVGRLRHGEIALADAQARRHAEAADQTRPPRRSGCRRTCWW